MLRHCHQANDAQMLIVGGNTQSVSPSGYTLGGGHSPLSRSLGLAVDNVISITMVTAEGDILTVTDQGQCALIHSMYICANISEMIVKYARLSLDANIYLFRKILFPTVSGESPRETIFKAPFWVLPPEIFSILSPALVYFPQPPGILIGWTLIFQGLCPLCVVLCVFGLWCSVRWSKTTNLLCSQISLLRSYFSSLLGISLLRKINPSGEEKFS